MIRSGKAKRRHRVTFEGDEEVKDDTNLEELKQENMTLKKKLKIEQKNVHDLKYMLVQSFSETKKKRRHAWDENAKVKKVCRDVLWKEVKFAPDSAYVQFGKRSIFRRIVDHCNLPEEIDEIVFWGNNREVVKTSLNEHRSNVTSRVKNRFKSGE